MSFQPPLPIKFPPRSTHGVRQACAKATQAEKGRVNDSEPSVRVDRTLAFRLIFICR